MDDYRCTGTPGYLADQNAILSFDFFFRRPSVDCNGVLAYYSQAYELVSPVRTVEDEVLVLLADLNRATGISSASGLTQSLGAGTGFVLANPAFNALRSRSIQIAGDEVTVTQGQIEFSTATGQRLTINEALISGTVDEGASGFVNVDAVEDGVDIIEAIPAAQNDVNDGDSDEAADEEQAAVQTIEAVPAASLDASIGLGATPASLSFSAPTGQLSSASF